MPQSLVLVNPWIYDFAAYDLWSKPLGLLYLAGYLRQCGFHIHLIDCLDIHQPGLRNHPFMSPPVRRAFGTGKFFRRQVPKPHQLNRIDRPYSRYGIPLPVFEQSVLQIRNPAAFLVTSLMTYWYPGVMEAIRLIRKIHPEVPVILGGIYARLCTSHAALRSGATAVVTEKDPASILAALKPYGIKPPKNPAASVSLPYPAFDLLGHVDYICLLTSSGCPYRCRYCASHFLNPAMIRRDPSEVVEEILHWQKDFGVRDFAFYDDALLLSWKTHIGPILEETAARRLPVRFHTPNALHVREINDETAHLMRRSGVRTIRLGLETADPDLHRNLDHKVSEGDFERAVRSLMKAGFTGKEIGAYVLAGLPEQTVRSVLDTVDLVAEIGATPYLAEYSPIPHSDLWASAVRSSDYDLAAEPLFHNNTLLPCWNATERLEFQGLRRRVIEIRRSRQA